MQCLPSSRCRPASCILRLAVLLASKVRCTLLSPVPRHARTSTPTRRVGARQVQQSQRHISRAGHEPAHSILILPPAAHVMAGACGRALQLRPRLGATRCQRPREPPAAVLTAAIGNAEISGRTRYHWPYLRPPLLASAAWTKCECTGLRNTFEKHVG
jgi:hypothetical protein